MVKWYCTPPPGFGTALEDCVPRLVPLKRGPETCLRYGPGRSALAALTVSVASGMVGDSPNSPRLKQSSMDPCLCFSKNPPRTPQTDRGKSLSILVVTCVDGLFILSTHDNEYSLYHSFVSDLSKAWEVEDEGEVLDLLNVEVTPALSRVHIYKLMTTYALEDKTASRFGAKPTSLTSTISRTR